MWQPCCLPPSLLGEFTAALVLFLSWGKKKETGNFCRGEGKGGEGLNSGEKKFYFLFFFGSPSFVKALRRRGGGERAEEEGKKKLEIAVLLSLSLSLSLPQRFYSL